MILLGNRLILGSRFDIWLDWNTAAPSRGPIFPCPETKILLSTVINAACFMRFSPLVGGVVPSIPFRWLLPQSLVFPYMLALIAI